MSDTTLEKLQVMIEAELEPYKREINKLKKVTDNAIKPVQNKVNGLKSMLVGLGKLLAGAFVVKKAYDWAKYSTQMALEVSAAMNQIKRTMGESTQSFLKWASGNALAFNIAKADAVKYGAVFSNLFSGFIKDQGQLTGYTVKMLETSAVVASATGRTMEDVMNRIRSGMLGSTEAIEDLGINVNIAMIKSTNAFKQMSNGMKWDQLDFQTQQAIRMMAIMEQASTKFGNTLMKGPATSLATFTALMKNAALNLGNAFLPVVQAVTPFLVGFAKVLNQVTGALATFMQLLFGKKASVDSPVSQAKNDIQGMGAGLEDASKGANGLGEDLGGAGKKAKALKKELLGLMGFDEINLLNKKDDSDSGSGNGSGKGAGGLGGGIALPKISFNEAFDESDNSEIKKFLEDLLRLLEPARQAFERLKQAMEPLKKFILQGLYDFYDRFLKPVGTWTIGEGLPRLMDIMSKTLNNIDFPKINTALVELWDALAPFTINVGEGLLWFLDNVLSPLTSWGISEIVPLFIKGLAEVIEILNAVIEALKPSAQWLFDNLLTPLATWTGGAIVTILDTIVTELSKLSDWCKAHLGTIRTMTGVIVAFFTAWKVTELLAFIQMSGGVVGALSRILTWIKSVTVAKMAEKIETMVLTALYAKDFVVSILSSIGAFGKQAAALALSTGAKALDAVQTGVLTVANTAYSVGAGVAAAATWALNAAIAVLTSPITLVIAAVTALVAGVYLLYTNWDTVSQFMSTTATMIWETISSVFGTILEVITTIATSIWEVISSTFTSIFDTVSNTVTSIWDTISTIFTNIFNFFGEILGKIWEVINSIFTKVFNFYKDILGKILSLIHI